MRKIYVDVKAVCENWGVSKSQDYKIIKDLRNKFLKFNSNIIVLVVKLIENFMKKTVTDK